MKQLRAWMIQKWKSVKASKAIKKTVACVKQGIDFLSKVWRVVRVMLEPFWVRRELLLLAGLYLAAVLVVLFLMPGPWQGFPASWQRKLNYVAKKDLDANYRVAEADIGRPAGFPGDWGWFLPDRNTIIGKYARQALASGEAIDSGILRAQPVLTVGDGFGLVIFPLDKQKNVCSFLNAGSYVDVADSASVVVPGLRVSAIAYPPGADVGSQCFAILEVDRRGEPKLAPDKLASFHLVMRDFRTINFSPAEPAICQLKPASHVDVMRSEQVFISEARVHAIKPLPGRPGNKGTTGCVAVLEIELEKSRSPLWGQQGSLNLVPRDFVLVKFPDQKGPVCKLPIGSLVDVLRDKLIVIRGVRVHMVEAAPAAPAEKKAQPDTSDKKAQSGTPGEKPPSSTSHKDEKEQSCSLEVEVPYEKETLVPADQVTKLHLEVQSK